MKRFIAVSCIAAVSLFFGVLLTGLVLVETEHFSAIEREFAIAASLLFLVGGASGGMFVTRVKKTI